MDPSGQTSPSPQSTNAYEASTRRIWLDGNVPEFVPRASDNLRLLMPPGESSGTTSAERSHSNATLNTEAEHQTVEAANTKGTVVSSKPSPIVDLESGEGYTQPAPLGNAEPYLQAPNEIFYPDNQGVQDYWQQQQYLAQQVPWNSYPAQFAYGQPQGYPVQPGHGQFCIDQFG